MLQYRILIFFLVAVASSLTFGEARSIRRNLNSNSNVNQINGGFNGHPLRDVAGGRGQASLYPGIYQPEGANRDNARDPKNPYVIPQIIDDMPEDDGVKIEDLYQDIVDPKIDYDYWNKRDKAIGGVGSEANVVRGFCDDDPPYEHPTGWLLPSNDESDMNKRHSGVEPHRTGGTLLWGNNNANNNANTNVVGSRYRRNNNNNNNNWGKNLQEPYPVHPLGPNVRWPHEEAIESIYDYKDIDPLFDPSRFLTTTSRPIDDNLATLKEFLGSNVNSNTNVNVVHGRRSNSNANSNTNMIGSYGGYGSNLNSEKDRGIPRPSSYFPPRHIPGAIKRRVVGYPDRRQHLHESPDNDDETEYPGRFEDTDVGNSNANVNSNSNVNIVSRRNNPRHRRSVESHPKKSTGTAKLDKDATTKVDTEASSTTNRPQL